MRTSLKVLLAAVLLAALAAMAAVLGLRAHDRRLVEQRSAAVVTAMRDLARLETAEAHLERVIDLKEQQEHLFGLLATEDALLLVAAGDVVAGVDLGALPAGAVQVLPDGTLVVRLPAPRIFSVRLDEEHTYVHSRRTDVLARRNERLEGEARKAALASFEQAALRAGVLERARAQADRLLRALFQQIGFRRIVIEWPGTLKT